MPKMKTSFTGLVKLLAKSLYPEPDVFVRELIQNAHDSIQIRQKENPQISGLIKIFTDHTKGVITFEDNGIGMGKVEIEDLLSTIGRSGTGENKAEFSKRGEALDTIGQFGIGFLSAFVVAEKIDVITRKVGENDIWFWSNEGGEDYSLEKSSEDRNYGTTVKIFIKDEFFHYLKDEELRKVVLKYADFIPYQININGNGPVNTINAPWHKTFFDPNDYNRELSTFANRRFPNSPLLIIPIDIEAYQTKGFLYITDDKFSQSNNAGVVDIYQSRMCIRNRDQELLPEWAKFLQGVIDSKSLQPTAARDNIIKNEAYYRLRDELGKIIIESLIKLSEENNSKFLMICKWHHYHLKGMASKSEDFFTKIIEYLPFETNRGEMTLKDIIQQQTKGSEVKIPIYYFSYGYDSNQFYEVCDAKNIIAINTGNMFDENLVKSYVEKHSDILELKQLDRLDSKELYKPLNEKEEEKFFNLKIALQNALSKVGMDMVKASFRVFEPSSMSSVLLQTKIVKAQEQMRELLQNPMMLEGLGDIGQDMLKELEREPIDIFLNANNSLIKTLSNIKDIHNPSYYPLLIGLYNASVLYSQHHMTPENAKVFYMQIQKFMEESLNLNLELVKCKHDRRKLEIKLLEQSPIQKDAKKNEWITLFVMMPYDEKYNKLEEVLREILESSPYYFELILARDKTLNTECKENIREHILVSDGFIADISEHSPNVMMEVGWVYFESNYNKHSFLLLRDKNSKKAPVDLGGAIHNIYDTTLDSKALKKELSDIIDKHEAIQNLRKQGKKRFLSKNILKGVTALTEQIQNDILKVWKTIEDLQNVKDEEYENIMRGKGFEDASYMIRAVKKYLKDI